MSLEMYPLVETEQPVVSRKLWVEYIDARAPVAALVISLILKSHCKSSLNVRRVEFALKNGSCKMVKEKEAAKAARLASEAAIKKKKDDEAAAKDAAAQPKGIVAKA